MASFSPWSSPVDHMVVAGMATPGIGTLYGAGSPRKWEERESYGYGGSISVFRGRQLAKFEFHIVLLDDEQWMQWESFKGIVDRPPAGSVPRALDVWHPWLSYLDVRSATVLDVLQPEHGDTGAMTIKIKFQEFRRLQRQLSKPIAAADKTEDKYERAVRERSERLAELTNQLQRHGTDG